MVPWGNPGLLISMPEILGLRRKSQSFVERTILMHECYMLHECASIRPWRNFMTDAHAAMAAPDENGGGPFSW